MRPPALALLAAAAAGCAPLAPRPAPPAAAARTWHVDAQAMAQVADGSEARPFKTVASALAAAAPGDVLHLHDGIFAPFVADKAVRVEGSKASVISGGADAVVVDVTATGVALDRLSIQGGRIGVRLAAGAALSRLSFSAHRRAAIWVESGAVTIRGVTASAFFSVPDLVGVEIGGGEVDLADARFDGPYRASVHVSGARARLAGIEAAHGQVGVSVGPGARVEARGLSIGPMRGACVAVEGGVLALADSQLAQCGTGIEALAGSRVEATDNVVVRAERAGVEARRADVRLVRHVHAGEASQAAVLADEARVVLEEPFIADPGPVALGVRGGALIVEGGVLAGALSDPDGELGNGVHAVDVARLEMRGVAVLRQGGVAVDVASGRALLAAVDVRGSGLAGVGASGGAALEVRGATIVRNQGPGIAAGEGVGARVSFSRLEANAEAQVFAACGDRARVVVVRSRLVGPQPASGCIAIEP